MNYETSLTATVAFDTPLIVPRRLTEDAAQALKHVLSILSLNDETEVEPGALLGMSRVLAHARSTLLEMRGWGIAG
jgi:hypothetical protein